jgi:hypothetical protein
MIFTNLLTNMVILTSQAQIPTNTPEFRAQLYGVILSRAEDLASRWHLDKSLINDKGVTDYKADPYPEAPSLHIVFGNRYAFGTGRDGFLGFSDSDFYWPSVTWHPSPTVGGVGKTPEDQERRYWAWRKATEEDNSHDLAVAEHWRHSPNRLTMTSAQKMAEAAMKAYGIPPGLIGTRFLKKKEQLVWSEEWTSHAETNAEGVFIVPERRSHPKTFKLPYYMFEWRSDENAFDCAVDISGITGALTHFDVGWPLGTLRECDGLRVTWPTNYLQLLGLPTNTIFVKRRYTNPATYEGYDTAGIEAATRP